MQLKFYYERRAVNGFVVTSSGNQLVVEAIRFVHSFRPRLYKYSILLHSICVFGVTSEITSVAFNFEVTHVRTVQLRLYELCFSVMTTTNHISICIC